MSYTTYYQVLHFHLAGGVLVPLQPASIYLLRVYLLDSMSYQNFNAIVTNKTSKISFDPLDKFSKALEIPVGDLFEQYEDEI